MFSTCFRQWLVYDVRPFDTTHLKSVSSLSLPDSEAVNGTHAQTF